MFERVLLGVGRRMVPVPEVLFKPMVQRDANKLAKRPDLEPDQRRVQHFAVREIPRRREAIAPGSCVAFAIMIASGNAIGANEQASARVPVPRTRNEPVESMVVYGRADQQLGVAPSHQKAVVDQRADVPVVRLEKVARLDDGVHLDVLQHKRKARRVRPLAVGADGAVVVGVVRVDALGQLVDLGLEALAQPGEEDRFEALGTHGDGRGWWLGVHG